MRTFVLLLLCMAMPLAGGSFKPELEAPYWKGVKGLNLEAVRARINNEACSSDARYFESCRQAVLTAMNLSGLAQDKDSQPFIKILKAKVFGSKPSINFELELQAIDELPAGEIPKEMIWGKALSAHLRVFDRYAQLMPSAFAEMLLDGDSKTYYGLGLEVRASREGLRVFRVHSGTSAERGRLRVHDRIVSVNGKTATNEFEAEELAAALETKAGETVKLEIQRGERRLQVELKAAPMEIKATTQDEFIVGKNRIFYHRVTTFGTDTCWELQKRLWTRSVDDKPLTGLILDLRHNPGGLVDEGRCVAQLFAGDREVFSRNKIASAIPEGFAETSEIQIPDYSSAFTWRKTFADLPVIVLIDERSKSMSEMVAAALQDLNPRAWIVGERSFGKGTTQIMHRLKNMPGLLMTMTVSNYLRPNGEEVQGVGVTPNFEVPFRARASLDERTVLREGEGRPNWQDPRQSEVKRISDCVAGKSALRAGEALTYARFGHVDSQAAQGLAVLSCENSRNIILSGVPEN